MRQIKFFALRETGSLKLYCESHTKNEFKQKVQRAYMNAKGLAPKGSSLQIEDFLKGKKVALVTMDEMDYLEL